MPLWIGSNQNEEVIGTGCVATSPSKRRVFDYVKQEDAYENHWKSKWVLFYLLGGALEREITQELGHIDGVRHIKTVLTIVDLSWLGCHLKLLVTCESTGTVCCISVQKGLMIPTRPYMLASPFPTTGRTSSSREEPCRLGIG